MIVANWFVRTFDSLAWWLRGASSYDWCLASALLAVALLAGDAWLKNRRRK